MDYKHRISERFACSIALQACDTLTNRDATIVDLSRHGAQVRCSPTWEQGSNIHLDLDGDLVWATVAWSEIDRMGLKFVAPLQDSHAIYRAGERQRQREMRGHIIARQASFGRRALAA